MWKRGRDNPSIYYAHLDNSNIISCVCESPKEKEEARPRDAQGRRIDPEFKGISLASSLGWKKPTDVSQIGENVQISQKSQRKDDYEDECVSN